MMIKTCPNCNGKATEFFVARGDELEITISCNSCELQVLSRTMTEGELQTMWNNLPRRQPCPGIVPKRMMAW